MVWEEIPKDAVFLFWSGGKDSYLALLSLLEQESNIVLCTTFANGMNRGASGNSC